MLIGQITKSFTKTDKEIDDVISSITPYVRSNDMKFFQHFLPGTPLEENSHYSFGAIFQS